MNSEEKSSNEIVRLTKDWSARVVREVVNLATFPLAYDIVEGITNHVRHAPRVLTKDGIYRKGLGMLKRGTKRIVVVNTVTKEDAQKYVLDWGHWYQKEYFEELFRIVQKNRHGVGDVLPIFRYTDLNDVQKSEEAISLLMYGSDVEIYDSAIPIEFLIRDDEQVLLGFPENNELSLGVRLRSKNVCATLNRWIAEQSGLGQKSPNFPVRETKSGPIVAHEYSSQPTPAVGGFKDPQAIARRIREKRETNQKPIGDHSLLHALNLLAKMNVEDPINATKQAFDDFDDWYPELYDEDKSEYHFKALAGYLKKLTSTEKPTFLDVGCAHGLGSNILDIEGVQYWGVDVSTALLERAKHKLLRRTKHLIAGDMIKILLEPGQSNYRQWRNGEDSPSIPRKLDVIACQGNTFDFFLGDLQKWFALSLFRSRLKDRGILFITQRSFTKADSRIERKLPAPGGKTNTIVYDLERSGDFFRIDVQTDNKLLGSVIQHPTDPSWLIKTCVNAGFKLVEDAKHNLPEWFGPRGGKPYEVFLFQLHK